MRKIRATLGSIASVYSFFCPGCQVTHGYTCYALPSDRGWTFNGDLEKPTFTPSLLVYPGHENPRCHLFMTEGVLHFCADSDHEFAGRSVPLQPIPDGVI